MRTLLLSVCSVALLTAAAVAQPSPNPLFQPPQDDAFGSSFFAAPNSRTLPNGSEVPLPTPDAPLPVRPLVANHFWIAPEFFYAASSRTVLPPLVTLSPSGATAAGVLGRSSTTVAFGGNQLSDLRPAMRLGLGASFSDTLAVDGSFLVLFDESANYFGLSRPGGVVLARPLVQNGAESAAVLGQLGSQAGIEAVADTFAIGGDVNLRYNIGRGDYARWDLFAGYRYFQVRDRVRVTTQEQVALPQTLPGDGVATPAVVLTGTSTVTDKFHTRNEFHGPQFGVASTFRLLDRLTFATRFGVAMGVTLSETRISGRTSGPVSFDGGLLATASNSGEFRSRYFSVIPSAEARVGLDVTDWLRLTAGYSFLYWSRLERAADQIDRTIATGRPAYPQRSTDYWLQGLTLGAEVRY